MADQMPASLAAVQAAGAMSLDLEIPAASVQAEASPMHLSPWATSTYCTSPGSPWSPATPTVNPVTPSMRQNCAMSSPTRMGSMHGYGVVPGATSRGLTSPGHFAGMQVHSPGPRSPMLVGTMVQSPGAIIRQNAANMGIPLHLRSSPGEVSAPVPVRSLFGITAVPSPVACRPAPSAPVPMTVVTGMPAQINEAHSVAYQPGPLPALLRNVVTPFTSTRHPPSSFSAVAGSEK